MTKPRAKRYDYNASYFVRLREFERQMLHDALVFCDGNVLAASEILEIARPTFYKRATILGGVFEGVPKREPYVPTHELSTYMYSRKNFPDHAEPFNEHPATEEQSDVPHPPAAAPDGKADAADVQENRDAGGDPVREPSPSAEPDEPSNTSALLCDEYW